MWRPVGLAGSAARPECGREPQSAACRVARQPVHAALQLQRHEPRSDDPRARQRTASRHRAQPSRPEPGARPGRPVSRPVRTEAGRVRAAICRMQTGSRHRLQDATDDTAHLRAHPRVARCDAGAGAGHELSARARSTCRTRRTRRTCTRTACTCIPASTPTARSATTRSRACCRAPTARCGAPRRTPNCRRPLEPTERVGEGRYEYALSVPRKGAAAGAPVPASTRHALVSPAFARRHARSSRQRPRRFPDRRRRRR